MTSTTTDLEPADDAADLRRHSVAAAARWLWLAVAAALVVKALVEIEQHTTYPGFAAGTHDFLADRDPYATSQWEYRYSPTFSAAFSAFTALPARLGGATWNLVCLGVLWWGLQQLLQHVIPQRWSEARRSAFMLLALLVAFRGLWASQTTPLVVGLLCGGAAAFVQRSWWRASLLLAIPAYIKLWPLAAALLYACRRPRQLVGRLCMAFGALSLVPLALKAPHIVWWQYGNWFQALLGPMQVRHIYRDLWTLWEVIAPPVPPIGYLAVQIASALAVLALCLWHWLRSPNQVMTDVFERRQAMFVLSLWTAWQLIVGPGVERNTYCLCAPVLAWGLLTCCETRVGRWLMLPAYGLVAIFSFGAFERQLVDRIPLVLGALPIGAALFLTWTIFHACRWHEPVVEASLCPAELNEKPILARARAA